ncbi:hypothetical protein ACCD10_32790, partial [Pseudomonas sp. Pseusp122]|uniref:hypothetical protein n=1 Tax=Pseudomonas sp. Pseusp122 TaxID=3243009 RepID=UPI0039B01262
VIEVHTLITITMSQGKADHGQALAVRVGDYIGIKLIKWRSKLADFSGFFKVLVVKNGNQARAAIEFPKGTLGCAKPDFWEVFDDNMAN